MTGFWVSIILGTAIAGLYGISSWATLRFALGRPSQQFMLLVFGGMTARLFVAAAILTLLMVFVPLHMAAFLGSFAVGFLIGLAAEVIVLHNRQKNLHPAS